MSLGAVGTDLRVPLRGKIMQTGATLGGQFKYVNLFDANGLLIENTTISTAAAPIGTSFLRVAHAIYDFTVDGGTIGLITPVSTAAIPASAIIIGATINSVVAGVGVSGTLSVGTSAGSSASAILAATAVASLSLDAILNGVPTLAVPVKMTAAGNITVTIATTNFTAGRIEIFVYYVVASNA